MLPQPNEEHAQHWPVQFDAVSIQSLPPELLREVFSSHITLSYRPFRLAHVCRLWRQVAFASPELWVSLWVPYVPPSLGHRQADYVDVWRQWLSRCSGGWPLHLDFHVNHGGNKFFICNKLLAGYSRHCSRLVVSEVELPDSAII